MKKASLASLQVEMGDPPYEERRKGLIAKSFLNICSFDNNHPTKITLQDDVKFSFYSKNIKAKQKPYYITAQEVLKENNYIPDNIYSHRSLFGLLYFFIWPLFYLLFSDLQLLITLLASSNSSVFLLFTVFDYPFGIFKLFGLSSIYSF
jgi:hypothetical protein